MRAGLTWHTMEKHRQNLPKYQACTIVAGLKSLMDFNADPGPRNPNTPPAVDPNNAVGPIR